MLGKVVLQKDEAVEKKWGTNPSGVWRQLDAQGQNDDDAIQNREDCGSGCWVIIGRIWLKAHYEAQMLSNGICN